MKSISLLSTAVLVSGLAFGLAGQADATTFKFDWEKSQGGGNLGKSVVDPNHTQLLSINHSQGYYETVTTTFDDVTDEFTFAATFSDKGSKVIDGGWVVISNGPNPKGHGEEFAIFYLDGKNNRATAYAYNGKNKSDSWRTNADNYLGSWDMDYERGDGTSALSFSLDATEINSRTDIDEDWKGVTFGEQVGIWFHAGHNTKVGYSEEGEVTSFRSSAAWYDTNAMDTEAVPEPTALLGLGLIGGAFAVSRRRQNGSSATEEAVNA